MNHLIESAQHWEGEAAISMAKAAHDRACGVFVGLGHPGEYSAGLYTKAAKALRLQNETGLPHCICHLIPSGECKFSSEKKFRVA